MNFKFISKFEDRKLVDYYKILELTDSASSADIKKAYRKLAFLYHPDKNQSDGAKEYFVLVNIAHETLIDPLKRKQYDNQKKYGINSPLLDIVNKQAQDVYYRKYGTYKKYGDKPSPIKERPKEVIFERMEKIGYYSFLSLGIIAFINSVIDLVMAKEIEDLNSFTGLIFSMMFTFLLFFSWNRFYKSK